MRVIISRPAERELSKLPHSVRRRFLNAFREIETTTDRMALRLDLRPLAGRENRIRLRIGAYRAVFSLADETWFLLTVGHRSTVYRP